MRYLHLLTLYTGHKLSAARDPKEDTPVFVITEQCYESTGMPDTISGEELYRKARMLLPANVISFGYHIELMLTNTAITADVEFHKESLLKKYKSLNNGKKVL